MRRYKTVNDPGFSTSDVLPPTLIPSDKPYLHGDDSSTSQLSTEIIQINPQLTSLYKGFKPYEIHPNLNRYNDNCVAKAPKLLAPFE